MTLGLLASGSLGQAVFERLISSYKINFVLTDRQSEGIIATAKKSAVTCYAGNPRNGKALESLPTAQCDVLLSVNYLFLIERDLIRLPKVLAVNIHGSLLPKYRGRTPHVWAIINNESITGITAHVIDEACDTGDIIDQLKISIEPEDTGADILNKFRESYTDFILTTLAAIENKSYTLRKQDNKLATYFGKRTPNDGQINWSWQKERIKNWVRAQAKPYPGAFTYYSSKKITIHKIKFSEHGYNNEEINGKIVGIENGSPIVKTPNGCITLVDFESEIKLNENMILL